MDTREILYSVGRAYRDFASAFEYGKTSDELFGAFKQSLDNSLGSYEIVYDYIWGADSLGIDGVTIGYVPKAHDTLIMDISVGVDGVWCDVCRTFFVGEPSDEQIKAYKTVLASVRAGHKALRDGVEARDVYAAVNTVYESVGKSLVHHAGHRIGEAPLLQPQFITENNDKLVVGNTYTVESGIYEDFGIRLENDYLISEEGAEDLFEDILPLDEIKEYILK